jgi:hypothetical protein
MIHGVFGKLGSGKGLLVVDIIVKELIDGFRDIVTNVPLRILPWVNGQGLAQIGLRSYLIAKLYPLDESEVDEILNRVHVVEDIDLGSDLFLWRRDGDTGEWFKLTITKKDEKGRSERFDAEEIKKRHCNPVLCVTDEAWQFYTNNGGWARSPILPFYSRQQRKLRDEWFIVTQHPTDCDELFWKIAQDFWMCRNHGMERMGIFRQPKMFRVIIYLTNPAKGNAIRSHESYHRLDKKLSQCYDTTAGVGMSGGFKGDANQKQAGLHIGWLVAGIVVLVSGLCFVPWLFGRGAVGFFSHAIVHGHKMSVISSARPPSASVTLPFGLSTNISFASVNSAPVSPVVDTNEVTCVGWAAVGNRMNVFLSDGRTAQSEFGEVQRVTRHKVKVFGQEFKVVGRQAVGGALDVGVPPVGTSVSVSAEKTPENPVESEKNPVQILPSISGPDLRPPPRLNGIQQMQRSPSANAF